MKIRLMVGHDHELVRAGLILLLQADPDIEVIAEGPCDAGLFNKLHNTDVDLLLLGLSMPVLYVSAEIAQIRSAHPDLPVLVLSIHEDIMTVQRAMKAGASGYISMFCTHHELLRAVRKAATTGRYLDPGVAEKLFFSMNSTLGTDIEMLAFR